jgi:hypothetical protein
MQHWQGKNDAADAYCPHLENCYLFIEKAMVIVGMLDAFERKYRAIFESILCWGGLRRERASFSPGIPHTLVARGRSRPC